MRLYRTTMFLVPALVAATACNEALVPEFNTETGYPHTVAALQNEFSGIFTRERLDIGFFSQATEGFARSTAYYTPSEERFVTELTGQSPLDDDNFGAGIWQIPYVNIKNADTVIGVLPTLTLNGAALPAANVKALTGVAETMKGLMYMYIALSHDTNGVAMNSPGQPYTGTLAPILCARDSWKEIVAILDSAKADLDAAGASTTLGIPGAGGFTLQMPPGYASLGGSAGSFEALTLALRGRARVEYAYAVARGPGGTAPSANQAGSPDQSQLDSAITDITSSALYSSLSPSQAIAANDVGVFHSFSSAAGDISNPIFTNAASTFVLKGAAHQMDTANDQRLLAKFAVAPALPTSVGANSASSMAYLNNLNLATPIPIIRNVELHFLLARAYLGTNQLLKAAHAVDSVRTIVGGLQTGFLPVTLIHVDSVDANGKVVKTDTTVTTLDPTSYPSTRDFLMRELRPTLINDGEGEMITAIRDLGLVMQDLTTWGSTDYHTSIENIPVVERQQRHNSYAPVCP